MAKEKFEEALGRLEDIVKKMEAGDMTLEESLKAFEEGINSSVYVPGSSTRRNDGWKYCSSKKRNLLSNHSRWKRMSPNLNVPLGTYLDTRKKIIDEALERYIPGEDNYPPVIFKALRYSLFAGGKRIRPILCLASAEAVGGDIGSILPAACALELIHTYSLIHDDLPAMDDDDYRRGDLQATRFSVKILPFSPATPF